MIGLKKIAKQIKSRGKKPLNELEVSFFYSVYDEKEAVEYSISKLREIYPNSAIYLVSDGGENFQYLEKKYNNLKSTYAEDTMTKTFEIDESNYLFEENQIVISKCVMSLLDRLDFAISFSKTEYMVMMDPDALIRGRLTIPSNAKLLGSRINSGFPRRFRKILNDFPGGISINRWGATPAIFHVETFLRARTNLLSNWWIFEKLSKCFPAMYAHDVIMPVMFALIGEKEIFNSEITECFRDKNWQSNGKPLVHQYRLYY